MKELTDREENIVLATIHLLGIELAKRYSIVTKDYSLGYFSLNLTKETVRDIRNLIQRGRKPRTKKQAMLPPLTKEEIEKSLRDGTASFNT